MVCRPPEALGNTSWGGPPTRIQRVKQNIDIDIEQSVPFFFGRQNDKKRYDYSLLFIFIKESVQQRIWS